jgi:hypothetical protein
MTKIPLGKVAFTDAGSYNAGKTYKRFDFVDTEDSSYLSLQDNNKGHAVTETAWWKCLARGTKATEAAKKANDAAALANEKAVAADTAGGGGIGYTAAGRVNAAITQANTAATNAQQQASAAGEAAAEATESVAEMNAALARLEELEQTITAKDRKQPTGMELEFPKKITKGNKDILRVIATLSPAGTGNNVLFLGDDKAVSVAPDGFLTVNSVGISKIHVIPTENTSIYRTIDIEVVPQSVRLCTKSTLRLTANGKFRFN